MTYSSTALRESHLSVTFGTMLLPVIVVQGLLHSCLGDHSNDPQVATSKGVVRGLMVDHSATSGAKFRAFLGIPYADKPVRFKLAQSRTPWKDVLVAHKDGPACPQPLNVIFSEDCLYLNIFTPQDATPNSLLPVMFFIHGSAYAIGSGSSHTYGPDFLIPKGVILVTFNYRLGILGFLTLGSSASPANLGLHDSRLALQWVREEISHFGGDPSRITIFGESSGGAMVYFHYLSPISAGEGLFQRTIAESGTALVPGALQSRTEAARRGHQLAQEVGCNTTADDHHIIECLRATELQTLINHTYIPINDLITGFFKFADVIDDTSWQDLPFFGDSLENLINEAVSRSIPLISGVNAQDGSFIVGLDNSDVWKTTENQLKSFIPEAERKRLSKEELNFFSKKLKKHYFTDSSVSKVKETIKLFTDSFFAYSNIKFSLDFKKFTYGYVFDYNGTWLIPNPEFPELNLTDIVPHAAELPYLFLMGIAIQDLNLTKENIPNLKMKDIMCELWTNFAKTGAAGHGWQPLSEGNMLLLDTSPSKLPLEQAKARYYNFWHNFYKEVKEASLSSSAIIGTASCAIFIIMTITHFFITF